MQRARLGVSAHAELLQKLLRQRDGVDTRQRSAMVDSEIDGQRLARQTCSQRDRLERNGSLQEPALNAPRDRCGSAIG